jgi:hypothetical protein
MQTHRRDTLLIDRGMENYPFVKSDMKGGSRIFVGAQLC